MKAPTGLIKIKGRYYAQVRVPSDIVESYGRKQHKTALKTGDYAEACKQFHSEVAAIKRGLEEHRAKLIAARSAAPTPAPTPQGLADLARQHGQVIAQRELDARADLSEKAVADTEAFWHGDDVTAFREPEKVTYFDKLVEEGDLDRVTGYIVHKRAQDRIAELRRMMKTGDLTELLELAEKRSPGLDHKVNGR